MFSNTCATGGGPARHTPVLIFEVFSQVVLHEAGAYAIHAWDQSQVPSMEWWHGLWGLTPNCAAGEGGHTWFAFIVVLLIV